ncbi:MAG: potassium-transporting ATPase subunit A [Oscillatoriales cyanobacterium]|uniref:Potassium-transporting ATPase potassium-binding subunit n=1 Tax=Microcoleus anatoxicus PTRS2 TaxID=2705321 RepID=A0ABU8YGS1_9CYAN|nr:MAG: potassium-transporting ATPase subunit A [Oscillatoriales cyanobacterium]TAD93289.1 MAG: potassium-transporting ATPase subunit A [Oscillatoriales cyanobacterium]TAE00102.1 MAG: potassium-transporting ATPase subunit A [Oscillatoriales cyanobacterium]TAF01386.1 MAG: potassium-transporting ATPase subunit A [Oscillatoriales cyanobacterium]TAF35104.1 MAG: potassium-transporting ATPase subunit A [Oscillatoriales cyanobacterium]
MIEGLIQIALTLIIVVAIAPVFGNYMARVYMGEATILDRAVKPLEQLIYKAGNIRSADSMTGWQYARSVFYSNIAMGIFVFLIFMLQGFLPLNATGLGTPTWDTALHTTISFLTNTDQQHYSGETTFTYLSQLTLGFLMFTSAATGLAVGIAFIRGLTGRPLGNFYIDLIQSITRILLPLSLILGLLLLINGVPETLAGPAVATTLEGSTQVIARGPVAHFESIKQLGENGGGFFAINSAHPYENPNPFTNLLETIAMVSIPAALIHTYGIFANNKKQGWLIFWMVFSIYVFLIGIAAVGEFQGNPLINKLLGSVQPNLEGKEIRFGWAQTALWAVTTTGTMCGAVNGMHDSLMPPGSFATLFNLFLQIVWGGQGTGTAYLFIYLILSVFLTGLMVGRTPEFLGRKIEKPEIVLASVVLLIHPIAVLIPGAITLAFTDSLSGISNPGFHGISQVMYEYASAAANNGSGFEGLADSQPAPTGMWWNLSTCFSMLLGRYVPIVALLLLADSMTNKQPVPETTGTLRTDSVLFTSVTAGVILILGALTFFPVLALGPIAEGYEISSGKFEPAPTTVPATPLATPTPPPL